ncbi:unnamed protein product, partial [Meganyctiphanes norvegica]
MKWGGGGKNATKLKPVVCMDYRRCMKGVDLNDQIRSAYNIARKRNKRYYRKMYWSLLDKCIFNAWIIYNKLEQVKREITFLHFKKLLVAQLVQENFPDSVLARDRPQNPMQRIELRLSDSRHLAGLIGKEKGGRWKRRACKFCN